MVEFVFNLLVYLLNTIVWLFGKVLSVIFSVLPNSPFINVTSSNSISKYMGYLAWLLPIKSIVTILVVWVSAMSIYYMYSSVMRWIKLID